MSAQISSNNRVKMHHASKDANNKEPIFSELTCLINLKYISCSLLQGFYFVG